MCVCVCFCKNWPNKQFLHIIHRCWGAGRSGHASCCDVLEMLLEVLEAELRPSKSKKISLYALQNICVYFICCRFKYIIVYHSTSEDKWGYQKRNPFAAPIIQKYPIQVPSVSAYPVCPFVCQHPDWLPWCSRGQNCRVRTALAMQPQACTSSDPETLHPQMKTWIHISTMFNEGLSRQIERHQVAQHTCGT